MRVSEKVLNKERRLYCELILSILLSVAGDKSKIFPAFGDERKHLERRINMLLKKENFKNRKKMIALAITLTVFLAATGTYAVYVLSPSSNDQLYENYSTDNQLSENVTAEGYEYYDGTFTFDDGTKITVIYAMPNSILTVSGGPNKSEEDLKLKQEIVLKDIEARMTDTNN